MTGEGAAVRSVLVRIEGRVQGVWYRGWTVQEACRRGLSGWVRNRTDGSVEALFSGPADLVDDMLAACWQGPPSAHPTKVTVKPYDAPDGAGFRALATC